MRVTDRRSTCSSFLLITSLVQVEATMGETDVRVGGQFLDLLQDKEKEEGRQRGIYDTGEAQGMVAAWW